MRDEGREGEVKGREEGEEGVRGGRRGAGGGRGEKKRDGGRKRTAPRREEGVRGGRVERPTPCPSPPGGGRRDHMPGMSYCLYWLFIQTYYKCQRHSQRHTEIIDQLQLFNRCTKHLKSH